MLMPWGQSREQSAPKSIKRTQICWVVSHIQCPWATGATVECYQMCIGWRRWIWSWVHKWAYCMHVYPWQHRTVWIPTAPCGAGVQEKGITLMPHVGAWSVVHGGWNFPNASYGAWTKVGGGGGEYHPNAPCRGWAVVLGKCTVWWLWSRRKELPHCCFQRVLGGNWREVGQRLW